VNKRERNHDSLWFILDAHDGQTKYQCHEIQREHIKVVSVKNGASIILKWSRPSGLHLKSHMILIS